jgi:hypothetical protein
MESDPFATIRGLIAEWDLQHVNGTEHPSPFIDWPQLANETLELEWLVEGMWPMGKQVALFAAHKTGKSLLSLHIAASIVLGVDAFTGAPITPRRVMYLDREMSRADIQERLFDMGHYERMMKGELEPLRYALHPVMPPLDTAEGGRWLLAQAKEERCDAVIVDTLARVVEGPEDKADTYKAFSIHTGGLLIANGIALMRLDHEGKKQGEMRGSSAKGDDVDIAYQMKEVDGGYLLVRHLSRVGYVAETIVIRMSEDPLSFVTTSARVSYVVGTPERAKELANLGLPIDISVRGAQRWLRDRGLTVGKNNVLTDAIKYRKEREGIDEFLQMGEASGGNARELET